MDEVRSGVINGGARSEHNESAQPPLADMQADDSYFAFGPDSDMQYLFDNLVGVHQHRLRHGEAERLGRLRLVAS